MRYPSLILLLLAIGFPALAGDWPQFRGPTRTGVAADDGKLAESWPEGGPKLLWTSEPIPHDKDGGFASPTVAHGKVYLYVAWKYQVPLKTRKLSGRDLSRLGKYEPEAPEALVNKIEAARQSDELKKVDRKELKQWIDQWIEKNLDEDQRKQYDSFAEDRLKRGDKAMSLDALAKAHSIKDKEMSPEEFDKWLAGAALSKEDQEAIRKAVPTTEDKCKDVIIAVDARTGKTAWKKEYEGKVRGWGASGSVCIADGRTYFVGTTGIAYCHDATTGEEIWQQEVSRGETNSSFVVADGKAVVLAGHLIALDARSGSLLWKQDKVRGKHESPAIWEHEGKTYVIAGSKKLSCVDIKDGSIKWTVEGGDNTSPVAAGNLLATQTNDKKKGLIVYRISPEKAELLINVDASVRGASPIVSGSKVYALPNGAGLIIDGSQGKLVHKAKVPKETWASPILVGEKIVTIAGGDIVLMKLAEGKLQTLAKAKANPIRCASPAYADGKLYVRSKDGLRCYDLTASSATP